MTKTLSVWLLGAVGAGVLAAWSPPASSTPADCSKQASCTSLDDSGLYARWGGNPNANYRITPRPTASAMCVSNKVVTPGYDYKCVAGEGSSLLLCCTKFPCVTPQSRPATHLYCVDSGYQGVAWTTCLYKGVTAYQCLKK